MSIAALNWVKRMDPTRIKATPRSVLREMADFADERDECWPSVETLCRCTSLSVRAVQESLRVLEQLGLVVTITRRGTSSRYRLILQMDLTQPLGGAPDAPLRRRRQTPMQKPTPMLQTLKAFPVPASGGADGAPPAEAAPEGCATCTGGVQISSLRGAPGAPKPPRTSIKPPGGGAQARATPRPLAADWQPSGEDRAHAVALGLDPEVLAPRFRDHFLASGRPLADVAARWRLWCAEDAARRAELAPKPAAVVPAATEPGIGGALADAERRMLDRWSRRRAAGEHLGQMEADLARQLSPAGLAELHRRQDEAGPTEADREWLARWEEAEGPRRQALHNRLPALLSRPGLAAWRSAGNLPATQAVA